MSTASGHPSPNGDAKVVCVTGASGYVASWVVKLLLQSGYTVKATVRDLGDPKKVDHLKALEGARERLHLFQAHLTEDGSFDSAVDGCQGVFHVASPLFFSAADPQAEIVDPAVKGTINVLRSCSKTPSVRRVVLTSSVAAVLNNNKPRGPDVVVDETWFSEPDCCKGFQKWYFLSKTLQEKAAWEFAKENGIDLVVLLPGLVIGPLLQPTLNFSSEIFLKIVGEKEQLVPSYEFVDARDVANAHIAAFENPSANGRYILVGSVITDSETKKILHRLYPSITAPPESDSDTEKPPFLVSKKKAEDLGVNFTPLEVSFRDNIESLKEKNFLTHKVDRYSS